MLQECRVSNDKCLPFFFAYFIIFVSISILKCLIFFLKKKGKKLLKGPKIISTWREKMFLQTITLSIMVSRTSSSRSMPYSDRMATTICLTWKKSQVNITVPTVDKLKTIGGYTLYKIEDVLMVILCFTYYLMDMRLP